MYVVLSFEDDKDAEEFAKSVSEAVAMVKKPTIFCQGGHTMNRRVMGFTQGKKWGWWVCVTCKRPTRLWAASYKGVISSGRNLLFPDNDKPGIPFWEIPPGVPDVVINTKEENIAFRKAWDQHIDESQGKSI